MLYSGDPAKDEQQDGHASSWRLDKNSCDRLRCAHLTSQQNFHNKILTKNYVSHHHQCSAQGRVLHCKIRHQGCNSGQRQVFHCKLGNLGCFLHPTLSLASEQTLKIWKDPRGTNEEARRVDLANWALRTSPKFATRVKPQFHLGFLTWSEFRKSQSPFAPIFLVIMFFKLFRL